MVAQKSSLQKEKTLTQSDGQYSITSNSVECPIIHFIIRKQLICRSQILCLLNVKCIIYVKFYIV